MFFTGGRSPKSGEDEYDEMDLIFKKNLKEWIHLWTMILELKRKNDAVVNRMNTLIRFEKQNVVQDPPLRTGTHILVLRELQVPFIFYFIFNSEGKD